MADQVKGPVMGIDLGTTYSCVGVWHNNHVEILQNKQGLKKIPSCVVFTDSGRLIGDEAGEDHINMNPKNTIIGAKRLIGRRFTDPLVQSKLHPYKVVAGLGDRPRIVVNYNGEERQFAPQEISAMVLAKMRQIAEAHVKTTVTDAVITVPACFNAAQRQATKEAGKIAGLNVIRILNEPTAAAIAYGVEKKLNGSRAPEKKVLVLNFGGGSFDASVFTFKNGKFTVEASAGSSGLGGEDMNKSMVDHFVDEFKREKKRDIDRDPRAMMKLWNECEKAKRTLSITGQSKATIQVESLFEGIDFKSTLTRKEFEKLNEQIFRKLTGCVEELLRNSGLNYKSIHDFVLVGGSTQIPMVEQVLQDLFQGKELCTSIYRDEAVAYGATVQAAILSGAKNCENLFPRLSWDLTALPLRLNNARGVMHLIPRNTKIPASKSITVNWDKKISGGLIQVYQGETMETEDTLSKFVLSDISPARGSARQMLVCFKLDVDGILNVSVKNESTGLKNTTTLRKLGEDEIDKMVKDAERDNADDEKHKKKVEAKNALQTYAYQQRKFLKSWKFIFSLSKGTALKSIDKVIKWSDENQPGEAQVYWDKLKELESVCKKVKGIA